MGIPRIVSILLIVLIVGLLIGAVLTQVWPLAKSILGISDKITLSPIEKARDFADVFFENYKKCVDIDDDDICKCVFDFNLDQGYVIRLLNKEDSNKKGSFRVLLMEGGLGLGKLESNKIINKIAGDIYKDIMPCVYVEGLRKTSNKIDIGDKNKLRIDNIKFELSEKLLLYKKGKDVCVVPSKLAPSRLSVPALLFSWEELRDLLGSRTEFDIGRTMRLHNCGERVEKIELCRFSRTGGDDIFKCLESCDESEYESLVVRGFYEIKERKWYSNKGECNDAKEEAIVKLKEEKIKKVFDDFVEYFEECVEHTSELPCYCGSFDYSKLPDDYKIELEDLKDIKVKISFLKKEPTLLEGLFPVFKPVEDHKKISQSTLCFYNAEKADEESKRTSGKRIKFIEQFKDGKKLEIENDKDGDFFFENKVYLMKNSEYLTCFISHPSMLDELALKNKKCGEKFEEKVEEPKEAPIIEIRFKWSTAGYYRYNRAKSEWEYKVYNFKLLDLLNWKFFDWKSVEEMENKLLIGDDYKKIGKALAREDMDEPKGYEYFRSLELKNLKILTGVPEDSTL